MPSESFPVDRIERTLRQQLGVVLFPLRAVGLLRTLLLPLALVASLLLALPALSAAENTISGTVSLPDGRTATEDMYVNVSAMTEDAIGFASTTAHIAAGEREGTYTLTVESDSSALWRVYYNYYGSEPYLNFGYYSPAGTKTLWDDTSLLTGGQDHADIKLTLLASNTISGTVSLPTGRTATEGMYVTVYVQTEDYSESNSATTYIASGASDATYTLTVPSAVSASWHVYYSYSGSEPYLRIGYYSTVGTQPWTNQATLLPAGTDHSDINLVLLTGNTISGTVFLPDGRTATEDMYVSVSAQTSDYSASASATAFIPAGASEGTYTLTISPDTSVSWRVEYLYWGADYYPSGYYNATGTQTDSDQATLLPGGTDHSGIDLTLLIAYTVSGTVSLPDGHKAPDGGLEVIVYLVDENGFGQGGQFFIPAGEASVDYSLKSMPADTTESRGVRYSLWETTGAYLAEGYYSTAGTQWQFSQATFLPGGADYSDIDLVLLTGNTISGTITLPDGRKAPAGGLKFVVDVDGSWQGNSATVVIPENSTSASYAVAVVPDPGAMWLVSCTLYENDDTYLRGFYPYNAI